MRRVKLKSTKYTLTFNEKELLSPQDLSLKLIKFNVHGNGAILRLTSAEVCSVSTLPLSSLPTSMTMLVNLAPKNF